MIENICALEKIKKLKDNSQDIIYADPPYALGSTVLIGKDGKPYYKEARDFMSKWEMPDEKFWEEFFQEANRVLKHGGRVLFFGIDRQLMLFQYYAIASGLEIKQSLYWYFISNFPKATDLSKQIDKRLGIEQEQTGKIGKAGAGLNKVKGFGKATAKSEEATKEWEETQSNSELGKKYEGYKYSISPLKQVLETVMVFQKPSKHKSVLDDVCAYENGDDSISLSVWDIDSGRVPTSEEITNHSRGDKSDKGSDKYNLISNKQATHQTDGQKLGRYPSQMFIDSTCASKIDEQSGEEDASRILHHISYLDEELDLCFYSPKVSTFEREHGCENLEQSIKRTMDGGEFSNGGFTKSLPTGNSHPTLKPIKLNYQIAKLLKTPSPQNVFFPFAGAGSEIIGFEQAGFDYELFECSEISSEFTCIAEARTKAWRELNIEDIENQKLFLENKKKENDKQGSLF